ncbi:hypothetical protein ACFQV4_11175 [Streptomyces thermocarboxydus]
MVRGEFADLRGPEGGRAGPAVREDDGGRTLGSVHLDVDRGAVGGGGGQLAHRGGRA